MADAKLAGKEALLKRLAMIPQVIQSAAEGPLEAEVMAMAEAERRACPVNEFEPHPGATRDGIVAYRNPDRPLSWRILAGARDAAGKLYTRFLEFGHDGAAPRPFWFPTYRAHKKRLRTRLFAETRKALKILFPSESV